MLVPSPAQIFFYPLFSAPSFSLCWNLINLQDATHILPGFFVCLLATLSLHTLRVRYGQTHLVSWAASVWQVGYMLGQPGIHLFQYCHQLGTLRLSCNTQQILPLRIHSSKWEKCVASSQVLLVHQLPPVAMDATWLRAFLLGSPLSHKDPVRELLYWLVAQAAKVSSCPLNSCLFCLGPSTLLTSTLREQEHA